MSEKKSCQSWTISEEFWEAIKGGIPKTERDPKKKYVHAPGQGRRPMPARKALEGIGWEWQSLDGCMIKAPLALESVGKNPTDRGKNGDKTQCPDR